MNVFDEMLAAYETNDQDARLNAIHEVMQQIALAGLARAGFFEKAAFYGGTCLRIFHNLPRFSEDLDFSLLAPDESFSLEPYFPAITEEFALLGQSVTITQKKKTRQTAIRSAFLKSETAQYNLRLERGRNTTVKIEVDTTPPLNFDTEHLLLLEPRSFYTRCYTLPSLFAGKLSALMYRAWKNRVKGRDWYDFEWYVRRGVPLDFRHFKERAAQGGVTDAADLTPNSLRVQLRQKIASVPIGTVKEDVYPFVHQPDQLDIWTTDYFLSLAEKMSIAAR